MEVKWSGDYLDIVNPEGYEYECVHEPDMVLALPRLDGEYIVRKEPCPAYSVKNEGGLYWTMISGTVEPQEQPLETLRREMGEETPVKPNRIRVLNRKEKFPYVKLTTSRVSFYHFEVLDYQETSAFGDGSKVEDESEYHFLSPDEIRSLPKSDKCDFTVMYCAELV